VRLDHLTTDWSQLWKQARQHEGVMHGVRALLALSVVLGVGWQRDWSWQVMPVLLGAIASALTETDDNWLGRLRTQLLAMAIFALITVLVWVTQPWPVATALALALCAFGLTLVGALGDRYRALAFASLVFFIYVALSMQSSQMAAGQLTPYLFGGAAWYGFVSVFWAGAVSRPPIRHRLAQLYAVLGEYLQLKAKLLEPIHDVDSEQRRMALALYNGRVVDALGSAKDALFCRLGERTPPRWLQQALHQYLCAQDIHERTSSSHEDYNTLSDAFFRSDALYRCQRVLALQGAQCLKLSAAIARRRLPQHQGATARAIEDMQGAISAAGQALPPGRALRALQALGGNLTEQAAVLSQVLAHAPAPPDRSLVNTEPTSLAEAWGRIRAQLRVASPLFRHAVRLALALLAGFGLMHLTHDRHGYWIVLTITFVSQPHFAATLDRLSQRISGTLAGLAMGWALIRLFPADLPGSVIIAISGAIFLGTRRTNYPVATGAVTVLLLLAFHQLGMSEGVIAGRLLDTLSGSAIAGLAAWLVLPNWQARQWHALAANSLRAQASYLDEVLRQYKAGKQDNLAYRTARRNLHKADAALSNSLATMLQEPVRMRLDTEACGRFLLRSHTLLNYLSGLGAHRGEPGAEGLDATTLDTAAHLRDRLLRLADAVDAARTQRAPAARFDPGPLTSPLEAPDSNADTPPASVRQQLVRAQLALAMSVVPDLAAQVPHFPHALHAPKEGPP
jgi:YccS/YhfK family integral membrane protein